MLTQTVILVGINPAVSRVNDSRLDSSPFLKWCYKSDSGQRPFAWPE
jgi:hypothetical protein